MSAKQNRSAILLLASAAIALVAIGGAYLWTSHHPPTPEQEESPAVVRDSDKAIDDGSILCDGERVDPESNDEHCGECNRRCTDAELCDQGQCVETFGWTELASGGEHNCGLRQNGTLWCWGENRYGQIGDGSRLARSAPVQVDQADDWKAIDAGSHHTCGLRQDGSLWCWGRNDEGRLGDATTTRRLAPVRIPGKDWVGVSAGLRHSCAIRADGSLWCWGRNDEGQLGDGTTRGRLEPVEVNSSAKWQHVAAATYYTCGLQDDGSLWCWGGSDRGHPVERTLSPKQVGADTDWFELIAGDYHTCGLRGGARSPRQGSLWCWGSRAGGRMGEDVETWLARPTQIGEHDDWRQISLRAAHTCGLRGDGAAFCWGFNDRGQLGHDDTRRRKPTTNRIDASTDWQKLTVGHHHTCGIKRDSTLWCWGRQLAAVPLPIGARERVPFSDSPLAVEDTPGDDELEGFEYSDPAADDLEFFFAHDRELRWYRIDATDKKLALLRTVELPDDAKEVVWIHGHGVAVLTESSKRTPRQRDGEAGGGQDRIADDEPLEDDGGPSDSLAPPKAMLTRLCRQASKPCTTTTRQVFLLAEDDLADGSLEQIDISGIGGLPDFEKLKEKWKELTGPDDRVWMSGSGTGLDFRHCVARHYEDDCGVMNTELISLGSPKNTAGAPAPDPMDALHHVGIRAHPERRPEHVELVIEDRQFEGRHGDTNVLYCLSVDGSSSIRKGSGSPETTGAAIWLSDQPPAYARQVVYEGYVSSYAYEIFTACDDQPRHVTDEDEDSFILTPTDAWMIRDGSGWHVYEAATKLGTLDDGGHITARLPFVDLEAEDLQGSYTLRSSLGRRASGSMELTVIDDDTLQVSIETVERNTHMCLLDGEMAKRDGSWFVTHHDDDYVDAICELRLQPHGRYVHLEDKGGCKQIHCGASASLDGLVFFSRP